MSKGVILFAYNSRQLDYIKMAVLSGKLAKKHLGVPVSLITNKSTLSWAKKSEIYRELQKTFENVIIDEVDDTDNYRLLYDGEVKDKVPFNNKSRCRAWHLTPYERTLLIDSDFLIFSNQLSNFWNIDQDFLIAQEINDINDTNRMGHYDRYISDVGIKLLWATTIMFTKNQNTKMIFDFVGHIYENYQMYSEIYRYDGRIYRNDIAFSLANHVLGGFVESKEYFLPPVLSTIDRDILFNVTELGKIVFLIHQGTTKKYITTSVDSTDIHIMNKQSIIRNFDKLMDLI